MSSYSGSRERSGAFGVNRTTARALGVVERLLLEENRVGRKRVVLVEGKLC